MRHLKFVAFAAAVLVLMIVLGSGDSDDQRAYNAIPTLKTVKEFEEKVEDADRPVLVDFYATWCGPCKKLAPTVGSLAREYAGRADFYRVDVDRAGELAQKMNIRVIPTVFLYADGEQTHKFNFTNRETFAKALDEAITQKDH